MKKLGITMDEHEYKKIMKKENPQGMSKEDYNKIIEYTRPYRAYLKSTMDPERVEVSLTHHHDFMPLPYQAHISQWQRTEQLEGRTMTNIIIYHPEHRAGCARALDSGKLIHYEFQSSLEPSGPGVPEHFWQERIKEIKEELENTFQIYEEFEVIPPVRTP